MPRKHVPISQQETTELLMYAYENKDVPRAPLPYSVSYPANNVQQRLLQGLEDSDNENELNETYCEYLNTGNQSLVGKLWGILSRK